MRQHGEAAAYTGARWATRLVWIATAARAASFGGGAHIRTAWRHFAVLPETSPGTDLGMGFSVFTDTSPLIAVGRSLSQIRASLRLTRPASVTVHPGTRILAFYPVGTGACHAAVAVGPTPNSVTN